MKKFMVDIFLHGIDNETRIKLLPKEQEILKDRESKGNIRIKELAKSLHISQSPLEKRFRQKVGTSPKKFSSLVRFKNSIAQYRPGMPLTELGYETGFYDQAHFIKEFRNFTGDSPEIFFGRK